MLINVKIPYMMKNYFLLLFCAALFSCSNESSELPESSKLSLEERSAQIRAEGICTTIEPKVSGSHTGRVSYKGTYWKPGETIRIKFLNGDQNMQDMVKKYANEWTEYANIKFEWVPCTNESEWVVCKEEAEIKIAFGWGRDKGNWSKIGTAAKNTQNQPSMNLDYLSYGSDEDMIKRVVLHEFGHALGLGHEHQHPFAPIPWDLDLVYYYFDYIYGMSKGQVDEMYISKIPVNKADFDAFDKNSIMLYYIPCGLVLDCSGILSRKSFKLSDGDKKAIALIYPPSKEN